MEGDYEHLLEVFDNVIWFICNIRKMIKKEWFWMSTYRKKDHCHYSGLPSPRAYEKKKSKITIMKETIFKWYPVIIAFMCLYYIQ